jgi:prepilin-type N-terminal cleavage/methylation domain-containing protein
MKRASHVSGYTLMEVSISVALIAIGVLAAFSSFAFSLRSVADTRHRSEACNVAREIIEEIRSDNLPNWDARWPESDDSGLHDAAGVRRALKAEPFDDVDGDVRTYARNVNVRRLSSDPSDYRYSVASLTVDIFWNERGTERSVRVAAQFRQP